MHLIDARLMTYDHFAQEGQASLSASPTSPVLQYAISVLPAQQCSRVMHVKRGYLA